MNNIDQRLLEMKLRLECSGADTTVVSAIWESIEALDFSGLDAACLQSYFRCLDSTDQMEWIKNGGSQLAPECQRDVLAQQEACFKLELVRRTDCEDSEVEQAVYTQFGGSVITERRIKSAFDIAMTEKFGSDWAEQLQNPRGSQSAGTIKIFDNEKNKPSFMSSSRQYGKTVISLKPISVAKHPAIEIEVEERGTVFKREVLVHEPLEHSIECGIMLKEEFESLKVISIPMSGSNGDIAGGFSNREIFMVGLVPYVRHRQCRCADGWINIGGVARDLRGEWNQTYEAVLAHCMEADDYSVLEGWMADHPNPLQSYYAWKFPNKDSFKLAANAQAGVSHSRLNKNGLAPKIYIPHLDTMRQQQNCERFIQWNLDDQIRKLLGSTKLKSDVRTIKNVDPSTATHRVLDADGNPVLVPVLDAEGNPILVENGKVKLAFVEEISTGFLDAEEFDISNWYDEVYMTDEDGTKHTYLEAARKMLAKSWVQSTKNANRELARNASKNFGKMYKSKSSKLRNGDKSCTVNGARSSVLTESTLYLEITCSPDRVVAGFEAEFADGEFIGEVCGNGRSKIVDAGKMEKLFTALGFQFEEFCGEELLRAEEINNPRAASVAGLRKIHECGIDDPEFEAEIAPIVNQMRDTLEGGRGFTKGSTGLSKDDRDRMLKSYMIRLNDLSIESVYMDGDSPWLNIREHLFPEDVTVLCRSVNMDELERLQKARQLVEDCGMDISDIKQILTAYRKPMLFRKMFFDGEVRNQIWAGLK